MTQVVCTGAEFTTSGGMLELAGLPSVSWPFATNAVAASMQSANGLRMDPVGGLWVPQVGATPVSQVQHANDATLIAVSTDATGVYELTLTPWYLTNPSAFQQMAFTGWVEFGVCVYNNGSKIIEQWANVAYPPAPGQPVSSTPWQPMQSESPAGAIVWHRSCEIPVQAVVDVADQAQIKVRQGVRSGAGSSSLAQMRDWWVGLYGVTYLLDPGPVG